MEEFNLNSNILKNIIEKSFDKKNNNDLKPIYNLNSEYDNEKTDSGISDSENEDVEQKPKNEYSQEISTEGITMEEMSELDINIKNLNLKQCTYCNKFYKEDMIIPVIDDTNNESQCWHCLFWMNYTIPSRNLVDGTYGMTIVEYILKCKDVHEIASCTRNSDNGGCFLCEYNLGIPITDIKDLHKLNSETELPNDPIDNLDDNLDDSEFDSYSPEKITVEI